MKSRNYGLYAVAVAVLVVGLLWAGVPVGTLAVFGLLLGCPLMMVVMMRGMQGGDSNHQHHAEPRQPDDHSDHHPVR